MRTRQASFPLLAVAIAALVANAGVGAFSPSTNSMNNYGTRLYSKTELEVSDSKEKEKLLRKEIADRNVNKENEEKYIVPDGSDLGTLTDEPTETVTAVKDSNENDQQILMKKLNRLTKPRAYPLFMAEKAAELAEATVADISKAFSSSSSAQSSQNGATKERVVILGTGWGAASFVKGIDTDQYDVTVISPRNYFVFTPMLAGASVGTVEFRSITENIREINAKAKFLESTAKSVDPNTNILTCETVTCTGNSCDIEEFTVPYDRLIVSVGAQTNTFGIPGVREYCNFLKQVEDARQIRTALVNCFERASLPNLSDEERKESLTFAVIGAGPTGIEFAAELRDFVEQDGPKYYPELLKFVRIKVIEASSTVLAPFDKSLQEEAINTMNKAPRINDANVLNLLPERFKLTELMLDCSVKEVTEKTIFLNGGESINYGMAIWAAGNGPIPLTLDVIDVLGEDQAEEQSSARGRIAVDPWLRAIGGEGKIMAFGDCSCLSNGALPATAQVASQQGEYLASLMNRQYELSPPTTQGVFLPPTKDPVKTKTTLSDSIAEFATNSNEYAKPFQFLNLGILAYTGGETALAQVTPAPNVPPVKSVGKVGNFLWRSVYLSKQVSWRNRVLVVNDWITRRFFGRDITRL